MKILAIQCTRNSDKFTQEIFKSFIDGIREYNSDVICLDVSKLEIKKCLGCTEGWLFQSPGYCLQEDDMNKIYQYFKESELWIFSTNWTSNGIDECMLNLLDRLEPLFQPPFDAYGRKRLSRNGRIALLSFSENNSKEFHEKIIKQCEDICSLFDKEFSGALIRPNTKTFMKLAEMGFNADSFYEQAKEAGKYLAKNHRFSKDVSDAFNSDILTKSTFINDIFQHIVHKSK